MVEGVVSSPIRIRLRPNGMKAASKTRPPMLVVMTNAGAQPGIPRQRGAFDYPATTQSVPGNCGS